MNLKTKGITPILALVIVLVVATVVTGILYYTITQLTVWKPRKVYKGHFSAFGDNITTDGLTEKQAVTFNDEQTVEGDASSTYSLSQVANESFTGSSTSYVNLANDDLEPGSVTVRNATDDSVVSSSAYTMNYTDGGIKVTSTWDTASMEITYNWMPTVKRKDVVAEIYFEIDSSTRGGTIAIDWAGTNVTSQNTYITDVDIETYEEGTIVQELDTGKLQSEEDVNVQALQDGEYVLYAVLHHDDYTPNVNSGTYEKAFDLDFTLDSQLTDEPVKVEDYTIYAKTVAP